MAADAAQAVIDAESVRVATEGALQDAEDALKQQQDAIDAINSDITAKQADKAADEASLEAIEADLVALADDLSTAEGGLPALEAAKASAGSDYQAALDDKAAAEILSADADALLIQRTNEASQAATDAENAENARDAQQTVATDANAVLAGAQADLDGARDALFEVQAEYGGDTLNVDEIKQAEVKIVGADSDAESIEVTITDSLGNEAQLSATYTDGDGWTVAPEDLSGLADGMVTVDATLTDDAGNKTVSTDTFTKDTVVEPAAVLNVSVANAMMTAEEAENAFTVSAESGAGWTVTTGHGHRGDAGPG